MTGREARVDHSYLIPSRMISGSADEMLAQIDETIQGLLALRHLIAVRDAKPAQHGADDRRSHMQLVRSHPQAEDSANR